MDGEKGWGHMAVRLARHEAAAPRQPPALPPSATAHSARGEDVRVGTNGAPLGRYLNSEDFKRNKKDSLRASAVAAMTNPLKRLLNLVEDDAGFADEYHQNAWQGYGSTSFEGAPRRGEHHGPSFMNPARYDTRAFLRTGGVLSSQATFLLCNRQIPYRVLSAASCWTRMAAARRRR